MKFSLSIVAALATYLPFAAAFHRGYNIAAERPDGSCKNSGDWEKNMNVVKNLPGGYDSIRVYASSDCNTLAEAVPAALRTNMKILVGVWAEDGAHYGREKAALLAAMQQHGVSWIAAVSVGSEDLYRKNTDGNTLAQQVYDVRGMMSANGGAGIWVGHVDTWTAWVDPGTAPVIAACDFIGFDGYPYFQNAAIENAAAVFKQSLDATNAAVNQYKNTSRISGTPVWITETNWPVAGPNFGAAVPSVANAQRYWKEVWCPLFPQHASFVYTLRDYYVAPNDPSFGTVDYYFNPIYDLSC